MRGVTTPVARCSLTFVLLASGCATPYAYQFEPADHAASSPPDRDVVEDADLRAEVQVTEGAVLAEFTNKGSDSIQVAWKEVRLDRGDGTQSSLRPDVDLGWVPPGGKLAARLVPFAVPRSGKHAAQYEERKLELDVPMVVRNERKTYAFHFIVHVHPVP
jgi:hypothetical protein